MATLTKEERDFLVRAFWCTWEGIADDVFQMEKETTGKYPKSIPQDEVWEMVTDADRPTQYGVSQSLMDKYYKCTPEEKDEIMKAAFPDKSYGR